MKQRLQSCGLLGAVGLAATLMAMPAPASAAAARSTNSARSTTSAPTSTSAPTATSAPTSTAATQCPVPPLTQPFAGDSRWYALAPGEMANGFGGSGWTLTGGAKIVTGTLANGTWGSVLDLPAGATATSPAMCVDSSYPLARMETRTLGRAPDNSTSFYTVPVGSHTMSGGMPVLGTTSWATSPPDNVANSATSAEQVQFEFVSGKKAADLQVYNLYIDPSMRK